MIPGIFSQTVNVMRRLTLAEASRDSLNNPIYGTPTVGWDQVYTAMPCRIALSVRPIQFAPGGERILPKGTVYIPPNYTIYHEDRLITNAGIEYVVTSVVAGYVNNQVIDHYELDIDLP